jgi:hypothetical protein
VAQGRLTAPRGLRSSRPSPERLQPRDQISQILRDEPSCLNLSTHVRLELRRDRYLLHIPASEPLMFVQKSRDVFAAVVEIDAQLVGRALARAEANPSSLLVECNEIDLDISPIPIARDPRCQRKIPKAFRVARALRDARRTPSWCR